MKKHNSINLQGITILKTKINTKKSYTKLFKSVVFIRGSKRIGLVKLHKYRYNIQILLFVFELIELQNIYNRYIVIHLYGYRAITLQGF